ncbi:MAG: rod shape-determining protein RodA, partial [Paracoccaceae bacterium]|nr:rod shape-determining protein RodA [Paracoccaceae bacterium]
MSFLEYRITTVPTGFRKILHLNWALVLLICAVATAGFLMLYSVAGGSMEPWAGPQLSKFILGLAVMFVIGFVPIWFWQSLSGLAYA